MLVRPFAVALLTVPVLAQSNAVPGTNAQVYEVTDIAYYGRRGAAYPNGEAGFMIGHSYCNNGTVNIPWVATSGGIMIDTYPKIAFLLARESGGRMVQVSGKSYCKHSTAVYNFASGPCAPCNSAGGGYFFTGCSDTYSSGINSNRNYLAPTEEINPWLGTWDSQGSYFDRGDPAVTGPAATDRVKSLTSTMTSAFDAVKNRITVRESELIPGAAYYGQVQLVIQGEPAANRADNLRARPMTISGTGGNWSAATNGASTTGSVLTRWQGATSELGGNGVDDGRFLVAVKVTGPTGGLWHYEFAVQNVDNHRGGAAIRIPVDANAVVQNVGFRDIDGDPLNDWTWSRTANEITFLASANNPLDWNTFYNVWFDCDVAPSTGYVEIDQARPGPGGLTVDVESRVPSGIPTASKQIVGQSCGACDSAIYEYFGAAAAFDLSFRSMTLAPNGGQYTVSETPVAFVAPGAGATSLGLTDDSEAVVTLPFPLAYPGGTTTQVRVCSNGFVSPAASNGTTYTPSAAAFLSGQPRWAAAWHDYVPNATGPVVVESSAAMVVVTWNNVNNFGTAGTSLFQYQFLPNGTVHIVWQAMATTGNAYLVGWSPGGVGSDPGSTDLSATLPTPAQLCPGPFPGVALDASARPILGTTFQWLVSGVPASTGAGLLMTSVSVLSPPVDLSFLGMTGCELHLLDPVWTLFPAPAGTAQVPQPVPSGTNLIGLVAMGQVMTYAPPLTPSGWITSNGVQLLLGL